ncbi:DNA alkylation repair protein [Trujillonella endophytica]|uniref:3-methyladenine DNA glycosylase AlkD n=1 Tax=Trujillonella endophytica TaxID=673521 RepID=A0A1H8SCD4_9ACTN|nr:DNA alkylation repair protein [Trujillella endophytica]SEO76322.1 3-methyladenine DNA glycosylase AlkD [Trujillella endophytica]
MSAAAIRAELAELADDARAAGMARYFQVRPGGYGEGDRFLGIAVPPQRAIARRHAAGTSLADVDDLFGSPWHEERLTALFVLVRRFEKADDGERARIVELYLARRDRVDNWDLVDASAPYLLGPWLLDRGELDGPLLDELAGSDSVWDRRIAVMATFAGVRAGHPEATLRIADRLLTDPADLVHKAVGWMLREVGNRDPARAEAFLGPRYARMPRTMLRYAIERFPAERRRDYLAGRV